MTTGHLIEVVLLNHLQNVYIDSINSTIASCSCCESKFLIDQDGVTANGPALLPLKEYYTSYSGGILKIKN